MWSPTCDSDSGSNYDSPFAQKWHCSLENAQGPSKKLVLRNIALSWRREERPGYRRRQLCRRRGVSSQSPGLDKGKSSWADSMTQTSCTLLTRINNAMSRAMRNRTDSTLGTVNCRYRSRLTALRSTINEIPGVKAVRRLPSRASRRNLDL